MLGQHFRLIAQPQQAIPYLRTAANLPIPQRSLFHWHYLYKCLSKLEFARAVSMLRDANVEDLTEASQVLRATDCSGGDPANIGEHQTLTDEIARKLTILKDTTSGGSKKDPRVRAVKRLTRSLDKLEKFKSELEDIPTTGPSAQVKPLSLYKALSKHTERLHDYVEDSMHRIAEAKQVGQEAALTCRDFRRSTFPFLHFFRSHEADIVSLLSEQLAEKLQQRVAVVRALCR